MTAPAPARRAPAPCRVSPRLAALLAVPAHRRSYGLLEGDWAAVFTGRSHDFDDLRPYVPGDDVRDIDWKATTRGPLPLVKRYVARRDQTLLLIVPTGRELVAAAPGGGAKLAVVHLLVEVLAAVADARGDGTALLTGRPGTVTVLPSRRGLAHRARLVTTVTAVADDPPVDVPGLLAHAARLRFRRCLVVVLADDVDVDADTERALRRLAVRHEVLWVTVSDADPTTVPGRLRTLPGRTLLPGRVRRSPRVRHEHAAAERERRRGTVTALRRSGVSAGRVDGPDGVVAGLRALVREHGRARR
ncbi:DUF58 domain-containing protein [Kineococcus rhizosphaerae]|uniref:Uncharacterized protein DUF58 n=1 Tax=Kineococcus rhizosphaerae TaxID=559628 RepID=A0A2T0R834_9ACTN|nr:DUF58 domain-containing protein [Kineococcus rhizosphaerae]PRY17325.1 uncharacterized protein DUF58 [Kineococcus rhizosphaerae]